jgi:plasmid maintenance system antidote protein VapI
MTLYVFDIGERARKVSRFIGEVRSELQNALMEEKASRKLTQQNIASLIGVNRSVINRQLIGSENLTLRRVAELAWALGWDIEFRLLKTETARAENHVPGSPPKTGTHPLPQNVRDLNIKAGASNNKSAFEFENA